SAGSLTSQAFIKHQNRTNELLADAAERAAVAAELLGAASYPKQALEQGWRLTLRGQFHDILPGTSLPKAYEYSWNDEFVAMNRFAYTLTDSVAGVARGLDTRVEGVPLVVFNPISVPRTDVVEARVPDELRAAKALTAFTANGSAIPTQLTTGDDGEQRVLFPATLPALSFAVYGLKAATPPAGDATLKASGHQISNSRYRVTVNEHGDVSSIYDLAANRELLSSPMQHALLTEWPSEFPAWNMDWVDRMQAPRSFVNGNAKIELIESGPVRTTLRIERESEGSLFVQKVRLDAAAAERVEFVDRIDWMSSNCSLKATFPLGVGNPKATYNWDLGTVMRGNNHSKQYEVPTHSWLDLTDPGQAYGVTLLTPAKYGSDKPNDNTLRLTLLYTPAAPDYFHEQSTQDWGRHLITYALAGHHGDWRAGNAPWQARRLEQPLLAFAVSKHPGTLGHQFQLIDASSPQVTLQAIKLAENGTSVVVRLQELWGRPARQRLQFPVTIQEASEVTGTEQKIAPIGFAGQSIRLDFLPNQLRTISVKLTASQTVAAPVSVAVPIEYNLDAVSSNSNRSDGDCDGTGTTYPAEMLTEVISAAGVDYRLGSFAQGARNALRAEGQTIPLPRGYNRVHLLAAATEGPVHEDLKFGEATSSISVGPFTGYLGQWDNRIFAGSVPSVTFSVQNPLLRVAPAFLHRDRLAWAASHVHRAAGDLPYSYGYLYSYDFELPPNTTAMTMPSNPHLLVFAVSVSAVSNAEIRALSALWPDLARDARFAQRFDSVRR
ncbi:MAG: glycoside hydrolase family 38 C-terminal domain-containing protein, partial [Myxococcales bacterium]